MNKRYLIAALCNLLLAAGLTTVTAQTLPSRARPATLQWGERSSDGKMTVPGLLPGDGAAARPAMKSPVKRAVANTNHPTRILSRAEAEQFTYTWFDAGLTTGAAHESMITETATNPHQIIALLKKIYCDGNIPGPLYNAYDKRSDDDMVQASNNYYYVNEGYDVERARPVYYGAIGGAWGIEADEVTPPAQDNEGYTVLLVALKPQVHPNNPWNLEPQPLPNYFAEYGQLVSYLEANVDSVVLITSAQRLGRGKNQGTMFDYSGNLNQFFFISKGQARDDAVGKRQYFDWCAAAGITPQAFYGEMVPFDDMFEQFSPNTGVEHHDYNMDTYTELINGGVYNILHDCYSVIEMDHQVTLADSNLVQGSHYLTGLNLFVPDYRLEEWGYWGWMYEPGYDEVSDRYPESDVYWDSSAENEDGSTGDWFSRHYLYKYNNRSYYCRMRLVKTGPGAGDYELRPMKSVYEWVDCRRMYDGYSSAVWLYKYNNEYLPADSLPAGVDTRSLTGYFKYYDYSYDTEPMWEADYVFYNNRHYPTMQLYHISLEAWRDEPQPDSTCLVHLQWYSSLDSIAGEAVPQWYYVYEVVIDDNGFKSYVLLDSVQLNPTTETYYEYTVPQKESSYDITYIVMGQPYNPDTGENTLNPAWSNEATVTIPPLDPNELLLLDLKGRYESDFHSMEPANHYRNYLTLSTDTTGTRKVNLMDGEHHIGLYRFPRTDTTDVSNLPSGTLVATINLNAAVATTYYNDKYYRFEGTVNYTDGRTQTIGDEAGGAGTSLYWYGTEPNIYILDYVPNGWTVGRDIYYYGEPNSWYRSSADMEFTSVEMVDSFNVSTALNDHPSGYYYRAFMLNPDPSLGWVNDSVHSRAVLVPVPKTASHLEGYYTQDEVESDTDMHLHANLYNGAMEVNLLNNNEVAHIYVERGEGQNPDENYLRDRVGNYERGSDGSYLNRLDNARFALAAKETDWWGYGRDQVEEVERYCSYVPVIWVNQPLRTVNEPKYLNTYGADIKRTARGWVAATVRVEKSALGKGSVWMVGDTAYCNYMPLFNIEGTVPPVVTVENEQYEYYMYRAWCVSESLRDFKKENGVLVDNGALPEVYLLGTSRENSPYTVIGTQWSPGDPRPEASFGAPVDLDVAALKYVVRFYYKKILADHDRNDGFEYYVVEYELNADDQQVITALNELPMAGAQAVSTLYYNAQGVQSAVPFPGVNIVVTRYSDGSTRVTKQIK